MTIVWDFAIQTDRKTKRNRPDIVVEDDKRKTYLLNDIVMSTDNILDKEYNK